MSVNNNNFTAQKDFNRPEVDLTPQSRKLKVSELTKKMEDRIRNESDLVKPVIETKNYSRKNINQVHIAETFKQTRYCDQNGKIIEKEELEKKIIDRVKGIYSAESVTVNDVYYTFGGERELHNDVWRDKKRPAREIIIKRSWSPLDLQSVLFVPFASSLCKSDSKYRKTIQTDSIRNFLLDASISDQEEDLLKNDGKNQLECAYLQCKSIKIYLPIDLYDPIEGRQLSAYIEPPENSICLTRLQIFFGSVLRDLIVANNRKIKENF
jgi:hypothetical protein